MLSGMTDILFDGPNGAPLSLILAHGAGAPMDSPFMAAFAAGLGARGIRTARFEFPYMAIRRVTGKKRPPDRQPILLQTWRRVIAQIGGGPQPLAIGGKSMGGRMATLLAAEAHAPEIAALVCLGYPFHPARQPGRPRTAHLAELTPPSLVVQGERDALGNRADVAGYNLPDNMQFHWCPDGDHNLTPRKRSGHAQEANWNGAMDAIAKFLSSI
jgi:predicted alpha/beta-hydrolase family hydrolase